LTHLIQVLDWPNNLDLLTVTAGFSVGELSALIFSGALSFDDGRSFLINGINYSPPRPLTGIKQSPLNSWPAIKVLKSLSVIKNKN